MILLLVHGVEPGYWIKISGIWSLPDYDKECIGRATYILVNGYCEVCGRTTSNFSILNYWSPSFGSVLHLPHCNTWQCKLSAVFSMVQYYRQHRMYKLIRPFQDSQEVLIPRSNGSQTHGLAQTEYVFKRNGQWFVYAYWFVNSDLFYKIVPLDTYSNKTPRVLSPPSYNDYTPPPPKKKILCCLKF